MNVGSVLTACECQACSCTKKSFFKYCLACEVKHVGKNKKEIYCPRCNYIPWDDKTHDFNQDKINHCGKCNCCNGRHPL